jgi:hypothetical protein
MQKRKRTKAMDLLPCYTPTNRYLGPHTKYWSLEKRNQNGSHIGTVMSEVVTRSGFAICFTPSAHGLTHPQLAYFTRLPDKDGR